MREGEHRGRASWREEAGERELERGSLDRKREQKDKPEEKRNSEIECERVVRKGQKESR